MRDIGQVYRFFIKNADTSLTRLKEYQGQDKKRSINHCFKKLRDTYH